MAVARRTDPWTSWEAANSVQNIRDSQRLVLRALRRYPDGLTDEQLYELLEGRISVSGCRTRRSELVEMRLVEDSGRYALTESNRRTIIWRATDREQPLLTACVCGHSQRAHMFSDHSGRCLDMVDPDAPLGQTTYCTCGKYRAA